jgi:hypothetical protein
MGRTKTGGSLIILGLKMGGRSSGIPRNGKWEDIQFPISHSSDAYESRKLRYVEGARREAIEAIDRLKPYKDGNDALWLLYKLDNADKHSFIFAIGEDIIMDGVAFKGNNPFFTSLDASDDEQNMNLASTESLTQSAVPISNALLPALHQLAELVSNIVTSFRPFLE